MTVTSRSRAECRRARPRAVSAEGGQGDDRELAIIEPNRHRPSAKVRLSEPQAVTLATLLSGVRFVSHDDPTPEAGSGVHVETVVIASQSPAVGRRLRDIDHDQARVLAVIRDDTPQ